MPTPEPIACPDCGLLQVLAQPRPGHRAECRRCACVLAGPATGRIDLPLAFASAALLLFIPGVLLPLLAVSTFGAQRLGWLSSGVSAFISDGFWPLAIVVGTFAIAFPLAYLGGLVWVLGHLHFGNVSCARPLSLGRVYRWVKTLRPWMMLEVFLVGAFVAYSRINAVASIDVESGGWCLLAATFALLLALTQLDERSVWELLPRNSGRVEQTNEAFLSCTVCDEIAPRECVGMRCGRCDAILHLRKPDSLRRTVALVIAGYLLYIPANLLPVLSVVRLGREERNTILSGVFELIRDKLWPLAAIVFVASVVLPLIKLFGLTWMLISIDARSRAALVARTRLYRAIDSIGRWSNIDVFMGALLIALLQFGVLTTVHAGAGLVAFAGVVLLTMFATMAFDARLMWDAAGRNGRSTT